MATVVRFVAVISVAVSIAGSAHGSTTCDTCKCPLSNVEIINNIINARINATVMSRMEEFTVSFEERMNATLDEEMSTINATLSTVDAAADERISAVSATLDAINVKIVHTTDRLLSQPGKTYTLFFFAISYHGCIAILFYAVKVMLYITLLEVHSNVLN